MSDKPAYSYIGRASCGCVVAVCVDDPAHPKITADMVAEIIRIGLTVERVPDDYVREHLTWKCSHKPSEPTQLALLEDNQS